MVRTLFACLALASIALMTGCAMCASPYDYCGPTFTADGCQECMPCARACSILSPGGLPCRDCQTAPERIVPVPDSQMVGPVPGVQQPIEIVAGRPQYDQTGLR